MMILTTVPKRDAQYKAILWDIQGEFPHMQARLYFIYFVIIATFKNIASKENIIILVDT